jgi:hypothetical protein
VTLLERQVSLPRAVVIHRARVFDRPEAVLAAMRDPAFDPSREALLLGGREVGAGGSPPLRAATIVRDEPDLLEVQADADADAYLLVADNYYPGWRAEVDGQPASVERANYAFRAVPLPPGGHTVRLNFDPPLWRIGWLVALAAAVGLAVLVIAGRRRARSSRRPPDAPMV